jgi:hypothetical protein
MREAGHAQAIRDDGVIEMVGIGLRVESATGGEARAGEFPCCAVWDGDKCNRMAIHWMRYTDRKTRKTVPAAPVCEKCGMRELKMPDLGQLRVLGPMAE